MITERQNHGPRTLLMRLSVATLVLAAIMWSYWFVSRPRGTLEALPNPDLTAVESQVAEKIQSLRTKVENNPNSAEAWGQLGMNLDVHDLKQESVPCYQQAAALDRREFRWPYFCAIVLSEIGSPEALAWFEASQSLRPDYVPMHVLYGQALFNAGRLEASSMQFRRAIAADPECSHAHLGLARIALSKGSLEACSQHLSMALEINPVQREAHGLLAELYRRRNEMEKASRELAIAQESPKITPLADSVYEALIAEGVSALWYRERGVGYMGKGQLEQAVREFKMAVRLKPDPQGHNLLGELLQTLKRYDDAAIHHRAAISLDRTYVEAYVNLGKDLYEMGFLDHAIAYTEQALWINPKIEEGYLNVSSFYRRRGGIAEAIGWLRQGFANLPENLPIAERLAWLLSTSSEDTLRNGADAVDIAEMICEKTNYEEARPLDILAAAYAEIGAFHQAIETARKGHQLARSTGRTELANEIQSRLTLYEKGKPYREKDSRISRRTWQSKQIRLEGR